MSSIKIFKSSLHGGEVVINGYKHAMVQVVAAAIALNIPVTITNAPLVDDTYVLAEIIKKCGGEATLEGQRFFVDPRRMDSFTPDPQLCGKIHGTIYLMPAFAVRCGRFCVADGGGCQIGSYSKQGKRPISQLLEVLNLFGVDSKVEDGLVKGWKVEGVTDVDLDILSFSSSKDKVSSPLISGATKCALLCAGMAKKTTIRNPYFKTDVQDLLSFLQMCGFTITASEECIVIEQPQTYTYREGIEFQLTECVSEVMTYICLAVHTGINLRLKVVNVDKIKRGLRREFELLEQMKVPISFKPDWIEIKPVDHVESVDIEVTNDSIQSDHHPFFALMLTKGTRTACIREYVWEDRFAYVPQLQKLGLDLCNEKNTLWITPSVISKGDLELKASDTRAAALLLLASLGAPASIIVHDVQHLHRGYANLIESLETLGAQFLEQEMVHF
jgi:UDP-N-acetylglucosamine 1-carboxyvinyltransferase